MKTFFSGKRTGGVVGLLSKFEYHWASSMEARPRKQDKASVQTFVSGVIWFHPPSTNDICTRAG